MTMRRSVLVLLMGVVLLCVPPVAGQTLTKVKDIRNSPKSYANAMVTIEGFATQWVPSNKKSTSFYFLKDDWGSVIKVRTSKERPTVGERYRVNGPVGIDPTSHNDIYVSEEMRIHVPVGQEGLDQEAAGDTHTVTPVPVVEATPVPVSNALGTLSQTTIMLVALVVVAVILLIALIVWLLRAGRSPDLDQSGGDVVNVEQSGGELPPPEIVQGRTIKMQVPPPGTLKILPGRFEVAEGDEVVKEIRFYRVKGQSTPELTFGRAPGSAYSHIQLKPLTVSKRQAKITYINHQWILTNFAPETSNPTRHNGTELSVDGQVVLGEGDRVEMGEVVLVFHES